MRDHRVGTLAMGMERAALDMAPIMVVGLDGRIQLWTAAMEQLYGHPEGESLGRRAYDLLETIFPCSLAEIEAVLMETGEWRGELAERRRDGSRIVVVSKWSLLRNHRGRADTIMVLNTDITGELPDRLDRRRLASIIEGSQDSIVSKTMDGVVISWNKAAEVVFGYPAEEMIGQTVTRLVPPELIDEERGILDRLSRGERIETFDTVRRRRDGRDIHVSMSVSQIRDFSGKIVGVSNIARDIDDRKRLQAHLDELKLELYHASRLDGMGQMALALAHELNQPLAAASNYLSGTRRLIASGDHDRALEGCEKAVEQLVRAGAVVGRLRNFVKKSDGTRRTENVAHVVEEGCALALIGAAAEGVETRFDLASDMAEAEIDKVQVQQVVVNLVRNALEALAGSTRRELTIAMTGPVGGYVEMAIADTGPGLTDEARHKLFQPFNTTKEAGLGVGLSLCRTIVEAHGGQIWADDNPGGGAIFRFTIPIL